MTALAVVGAYACAEARRPARVEIRQQAASSAVAAALAESKVAVTEQLRPPVEPESVVEACEFTEPNVVVAVRPRVIEVEPAPTTAVVEPSPRAWLARHRRAAELERTGDDQPVETRKSSSETGVSAPTSKPARSEEPNPQPPKQPESAQAFVVATPLATNRSPDYPERERRRNLEDTVVVAASVDAEGHVTAVRLQTASRYRGFNRAALSAVTRWRFAPSRRDGKAIADEVDVPVIFRLRDLKL